MRPALNIKKLELRIKSFTGLKKWAAEQGTSRDFQECVAGILPLDGTLCSTVCSRLNAVVHSAPETPPSQQQRTSHFEVVCKT